MVCTACLVCLVSTVSSCGTSSGHTTKLEQSISLDIYRSNKGLETQMSILL